MLKNLAIKLFPTTLAFFFSLQSSAQLEVPPEINWKTLKTPHFEVIFNAEQQELGLLYGEKLEKAYLLLQSYFRSLPEKTVVVINDKTDITNGYATRLPYPHIVAFPTLPGPEESLADTGDWAFELLAHEFTHILTFEPANGVMKPLRFIFGNIIAPNILLPQWWKEGLAVEMETRLGNNGRLRSFYQESILRAMTEDGSLFKYDIAQANEALPTWPEGMRPYLFGSLMWSQMIADQGASVIANLNERHGARVPYFIETPAQDYLKTSYTNQYNRMLQYTALRAQEQLKTLREERTTEIILPKNSFTSVTAPAISPDGKHLALIAEDDANLRSIKIITRENNEQSFLDAPSADTVEKFNEAFEPTKPQDGPPSGSIQRVSWFPNSEKIVYDKIDYINRIERYSDLYTFELLTKKTTQLSKGLRGREPSVAPDGRRIVFVKLSGSKTQLGLLTLSDTSTTSEIIFTPAVQERISYPLFWDDQVILFSLRKTDGTEHLYSLDLQTKETKTLFPEHKNIRFAKKTSEGLLFTSGLNGALNLYLADKNLAQPRPVSNTLTALFTGDLDPNKKEIFATHMTAQGLKVGAILPQDWQKTAAKLPTLSPLMNDRYPPIKIPSDDEAKALIAQSPIEDYSPAGYLWPQYWMPFISGSTSETGLILQARTSGFDPLKKHSYTLIGSWDTALNRGSLEGAYLNQVTSLPVALVAYRRSSYLGSLSNEIIDSGGSLGILPNTFWLSKYSSLQVGWQYLERTFAERTTKRTGPFTMFTYTNYSQSGAQISPESGKGAYLGATNYIAESGYLNHSQLLLGGEVYMSSWLPKHHALMVRANGIYTPETISAIYGVSTEPLVFVSDSPLPQYILRGYQRGQIFGRNLLALSTEYRFPLMNLYRGSGTDAIYLKRLSGALIADGVAADGGFINDLKGKAEAISMHRSFWAGGAEIKLETTLGYIIPLNIVFGYYMAFNSARGAEGLLGTTLQVTGF